MSEIDKIVNAIRDDIEEKIDFMDKRLKDGLAHIVGSILREPTSNTHILSEVLPRSIKKQEHRYQYIRRFFLNPHVEHRRIMPLYVKPVIVQILKSNQDVILQIDQSHLANGFEMLMVSVRLGNRALPIAWIVKKTEGNIGFETQEELLNHVYSMLPENCRIVLMGDRFYGTKMLVDWCQKHNFSYRLRIKGNLLFHHENAVVSAQEAYAMGMDKLEKVTFYQSDITTNIGILHEDNHPEPWFIVMDCKPNEYKTLDYGMRWGIESMFSDFKSRGFGIAESHLKHADRFERLIFVLSLALYWCVSTGMYAVYSDPENKKSESKKKEKISFIPIHTGHSFSATPDSS